MAMSKQAQKKTVKTNGLDLIWESRAVFAEIMASYRECHELLVSSELFSDEAILKIDECAIDFRQMALDTVLVAKRVSEQWLTTTIAFFENLDKVEDPKPMLLLLGSQAKELGHCFSVIAAWARDLAGRFRDAQTSTTGEEEGFLQKFQEALDNAKDVEEQLEQEYENAKKAREDAQSTAEKWHTASLIISWIPIGALVTGIGSLVADKQVVQARNLEMAAKNKLQNSMKELEKRTQQNEKAKYIAEKAGELVTVLMKLEEVCNATAKFWTIEADKYNSHGASMKTDQAAMIEILKDEVVQQNLKFWNESKDRMEKYATAMSVIGNCFNFVTKAKRPETKPVTLTKLDLTLHVPSTVDVKKIMAE
jgi:hypothetical protein